MNKILLLSLCATLLTGATPAANDILLISPDVLAEAWKPFADWKSKNGKDTRIITLSEIEQNYEGSDLPAKIRNCVLEQIEKEDVKFVILGADSAPGSVGIPSRTTAHPKMGAKYRAIPTDRYYISRSDWDADDDGVYGEWPEDMQAVQYRHPDAVLGRIPLRSVEDVAAYTEKVMAYESRKEPAPSQMVYTCAVPSAEAKLHTSVAELGKSWPQGKVNLFFNGQSAWDKDQAGDHDLSPSNWVDLINEGNTEKMHIHGHGLIQNWILEHDKKVTLQDVSNLDNKERPLFLTTVSCFTGQFDNKRDPSISEAMLRQPEGGALLVLAPSREGIPIFLNPRVEMRQMVMEGKMDGTTRTMTLFWQNALEEPRSAGVAFARSQAAFEQQARIHPHFHFLLCELNLLGDPSLVLSP